MDETFEQNIERLKIAMKDQLFLDDLQEVSQNFEAVDKVSLDDLERTFYIFSKCP